MLNLRQLNEADSTQTDADGQHSSRSSINFRVPSNLLGNMGEPLDYHQSEQFHEDEPCEREGHISAEESIGRAWPVGGSYAVRLGAADAVAGRSGGRADDDVRENVQSAVPSTGTSRTRGSEVRTSDTSDCMDGVNIGADNITHEVRTCLCLHWCRHSGK